MADQLKKRNYNFNNQFHYLLIYIIIIFYNSESKNRKLSLINNESQIKITFADYGEYRYLSWYYTRNYNFRPSSIMKNWPTTCSEHKSSCDIKDETKTIILYFNKKIDTCEYMFSGLNKIKEIDLSNFDRKI